MKPIVAAIAISFTAFTIVAVGGAGGCKALQGEVANNPEVVAIGKDAVTKAFECAMTKFADTPGALNSVVGGDFSVILPIIASCTEAVAVREAVKTLFASQAAHPRAAMALAAHAPRDAGN